MIVPMKKVSLIVLGDKKTEALKKLRKLGILQIEIAEGSGERIGELKEQITLLENAIFLLGKTKKCAQAKDIPAAEAIGIARKLADLEAEKKTCRERMIARNTELDRLKGWGEIDPQSIGELKEKGIRLALYDLPKAEYAALGESIRTVRLSADKNSVKCLLIRSGADGEDEALDKLQNYQLELPECSTFEMRQEADALIKRIAEIDETVLAHRKYAESFKEAIVSCEKEIEFEVYDTGMAKEKLSEESERSVSVAYFKGFIEAENIDRLKQEAKDNSWGLLVEDPTEEDNAPTKLRNNKFVSLIYPLTDFLGTVPGYFEYDISGWFLMFILIFFGIIFGDGGYGLLIMAIVGMMMLRNRIQKKPVTPTYLLIGLFGLSTVLWGTLTCTWFGLSPEQLPQWLQALSIPVISNVYADKLWYLFPGGAGLTTDQNLQIFCFTLALIQLTVSHVKGTIRNKGSVKMLGDIGAILQLLGIYYLLLSLVVNPEVFSFTLMIGSIPIGKAVITLIAVGFGMSFIFSNFEGNIVKSILVSMKNIVSVLLGVVNVFSDIVSYIRLWAVGLAGAAISATVNELAGPLFGNFLFMVLAIILLVFGHGLNMILNILSVIVHGIRLNTLEFSSHLDMSWSGHKFEPFKE